MINIADIFDSLQETYPKELVVKYEQLNKKAWLFMTDCDNGIYSCFIHLKNRFIWRVEGDYNNISNIYKNRLRMKNLRVKRWVN